MNLKQIVTSVGMLVFVGAVVIGGTGAFFSDTETSTGNVFTAGSVTVAINDITHTYNGVDVNNAPDFTDNGFSFSLSDLKPLDTGLIDFGLQNGANEAHICAMVTETENNDNGTNNPETDAGDITPGIGEGELGDFLNFKFGPNSGSLSAISGQWQEVGTVAANTTANSGFEYCFGEYTGNVCGAGSGNDNLAQTDSLTADVKFYAVQTRNNPNFTCASMNTPVVTGPTTEVDLTQSGNTYFVVNEAVNANQGFEVGLGAPDMPAVTGVTEVKVEIFKDATLLVTNYVNTANPGTASVMGVVEAGNNISSPFRNVLSGSTSWNYGVAVDWEPSNEPTKAVITIEHDSGTWVGTLSGFTGTYAAIN